MEAYKKCNNSFIMHVMITQNYFLWSMWYTIGNIKLYNYYSKISSMKVIFSFSVVYIDESTNRDYYTLSSHFPWSELLLKNLVENNKIEQNLLHDMKLCIVFLYRTDFLCFTMTGSQCCSEGYLPWTMLVRRWQNNIRVHPTCLVSPMDNVGASLTE
jgi:hypothetical protein